jgi:glycosyltransferase involved in cell wall biosynthesis
MRQEAPVAPAKPGQRTGATTDGREAGGQRAKPGLPQDGTATLESERKLSVSVILPTINEIAGLSVVLPQIKREWVDEIILSDGGSTDGTVEFAERHGCVIHHQKTLGYGLALREAIAISTGDLIIEFQPDGNSDPAKIPEMIAKINEGYDVVIGSRYQPGAISWDDDIVTKIGNRIFTFLVNLIFRSRYTDTLIGTRIFRRDSFEKLNMRCTGLSWAIELPIRFAKKKMRIAEIPANEPKRIGGQRKMRPFKHGFEFLMTMLREAVTRS